MIRKTYIFLHHFNIIIWCILSIFSLSLIHITQAEENEDQLDTHIVLIGPRNHFKVSEGPISFVWENRLDEQAGDFLIQKYEVLFWSKGRGFGKTYTITPQKDSNRARLVFEDCKKIFYRHGQYHWQVRGFDFQGNMILSETNSFTIELPKLSDQFISWAYPYAVQFQYIKRIRTNQYEEFLQNVYPKNHLSSFSDLSLQFVQEGLLKSLLQTQERVFISSQVGLGLELLLQFKLFKGQYFGIYPNGSSYIHWFSTGLKSYSSLLYRSTIGLNWVFMPGQHLVLNVSWIPSYRVHYTEKTGNLRTFKSDGWEWGFQVSVPNHIIPVFKLFGTEIDFQRIPFDFHVSKVQDEYTGTPMRMVRLGIGYRFQ